MLIDSHCHLDRIDLSPYDNDFSKFMLTVDQAEIEHMLCISIDLENYTNMRAMVDTYDDITVTVGVHPNEREGLEPTVDTLLELADDPKVIGIGETGLDYFRSEGDVDWQRDRFRTHIRAAIETNKPIIVHARDAKEDTLKILKEENAQQVGGILHCFTEDWDMAEQAIDLGFYISFSGIVTFKNAPSVQEVATKISSDQFLIETDSPYLAPVPYRGKTNYPTYVGKVAEKIAELRDQSLQEVAQLSRNNFYRLFSQQVAFRA